MYVHPQCHNGLALAGTVLLRVVVVAFNLLAASPPFPAQPAPLRRTDVRKRHPTEAVAATLYCPGMPPVAPLLRPRAQPGSSQVVAGSLPQCALKRAPALSGSHQACRPALAHAPRTSARHSNQTGPRRSLLAVSIFTPVAYTVVATLGNLRHRVWPAGFCQDRWVAGGALLQCGHLAAQQAPPPFRILF
ncbi:hypothetical protein NDU88_000034 [Pleurodeles waltl]|uniref:Uncharacterized protein n=1 Tax=Pleurodeles waltl TaxID=8319 RepID=A0AAV7USW3_PLEWA|nr:hypothetical protein NDU88_000034 [Pleurodeles waltl]